MKIITEIFKQLYKDCGFTPNDTVKAVFFTRAAEAIEKLHPEIVICAAIKTKDGKVIRGHRHADAIYTARDREGYKIEDLSFADQGFVTSRNRYVSREEGRQLQDAAGIPSASPEGYIPGTLFSEDLY